MSDLWTVAVMVSGGLFVGGVVSIAWERVPAWRGAPFPEFREAFAHTLRRVDKLQPALLSVLLVSTAGFAISSDGTARTLAWVAAAGFLAILIGSLAWLVPIQRRLSSGSGIDDEGLRAHWNHGHLIRTLAALAAFVLATVATAI
jgi:hypothetical protein